MPDENSTSNNGNQAWNGSWHSESESHWHSSRPQPGRFTGSWYNGQVNDTRAKSAQLVNGKVVWSNTPQKNPVSNQYVAPTRPTEEKQPAPRSSDRQAPVRSNPANPASPNVNRGASPTGWIDYSDEFFDADAGQADASASEESLRQERRSSERPRRSRTGYSASSSQARRRTGANRNVVEYDSNAPEKAAQAPEASAKNDSEPEEASARRKPQGPSWYDASGGSRNITPRSPIDQEFHGSRRDAPSQRSLRFTGKEKPRRFPALPSLGGVAKFGSGNGAGGNLPFGLSLNALLGIILAILVVIAIFVLTACSCSDEETQSQETLTANDTAAQDQTQSTEFTISFAGDCTLGTDENFDTSTNFNAMVSKQDKDYSYFFKNVKSIFDSDDLTVVNFEGTLTNETSRADKKFAFKGPAAYANILTEGGVEAASTANNHSHDYGTKSYTDTLSNLKDAGITSFGYDDIAYVDVKGTKVALIGTYELAEGTGIKDEMVSKIKEAKENGAQVIIDYIHWGIEREATPDSDQQELGHAAIDAGATLVVGSHPHVIQGYEKYNGRYIVYSMGNFCFGGNANPTDKDTWIFQQTFKINGDEIDTSSINAIPCSLSGHSSYNDYQPTPATGSEKTRIAKKIKERSEAIS